MSCLLRHLEKVLRAIGEDIDFIMWPLLKKYSAPRSIQRFIEFEIRHA